MARLAFASEIKALRQCPGVDTTIDPLALDSYLALQYVPGPRTIHRGIHKLPPGHVLTVSEHGMHVEPFWTLQPEAATGSFEEAGEAFRELFEDAVRIRLMSDVPLGAFLSGGLDSALVVAAMAKAMDRPVQTFSIGFEGEGWYSELPHARSSREALQRRPSHAHGKALDMHELLPAVTAQLDEPLADVAAIPTYLLSKFAREHVTVALTGEGADELFAGYDHYRLDWMMPYLKWTPSLWRVTERLARRAPGAARAQGAPRREHGSSRALRVRALGDSDIGPAQPDPRRRQGRDSPRPPGVAHGAALRGRRRAQRRVARRRTGMAARRSADEGRQDVDARLTRSARAVSRLSHRRARVRFPGGVEVSQREEQGAAKSVAEGILPAEIVYRPKHGFMPPVREWLGGSLKPYMQEHLLDPDALSTEWIDPVATRVMVKRYLAGEQHLYLTIWELLCLEVWLRGMKTADGTPAGSRCA